MQTIDQILRTAGRDGASLPAPSNRIYARQAFAMEPDDQGVEHDIEVVVCTPSRWERLSRRKRYRADEFTTMTLGPIVVAIRISR